MAGKKEVKFTISAEDKANAVLKSVENQFNAFSKKVTNYIAGIGSALAGFALGGFFKKAIDEANEAELGMLRLAQAVQNVGGHFDKLKPTIDSVIEGLQQTTTFKDDELVAGLEQLTLTSGDAAGSVSALGVAADIAKAKKISLADAAVLVGKVMAGETSMLKRYGIVVNENMDAMQQLQARFGGFAAGEANTFAGKLQKLSNAFDQFAQKIGQATTGKSSAGGALDELTAMLAGLAAWVEANEQKIGDFGTFLISMLESVTTPFELAYTSAYALFDLVKTGFVILVGGAKAAALAATGQMGQAAVEAAKIDAQISGIKDRLKEYGRMYKDIWTGGGDQPAPKAASGTKGGPLPRAGTSQADQQKIRELRNALAELNRTTADGQTQAEAFSAKMRKWQQDAEQAHMAADELQAGLARLNATLAGLQAQEAAEAFKDLKDALLAASGDAVQKAQATFDQQLDAMRKKGRAIVDPTEQAIYLAGLAKIDAANKQQIATLKQVEDAKKRLNALDEWLVEHPIEVMSPKNFAKWGDEIQAQIARLTAALKDPKLTEAQRDLLQGQLDASRGKLDQWGVAMSAHYERIGDDMRAAGDAQGEINDLIFDAVKGAGDLARGFVAAAQAVGGMDDKTAALLQNVVTLSSAVADVVQNWGKGILSEAGWSGVAGTAIAALGAIGHGIFGGETPEEKAAREAAVKAANDAAEALGLLAKNAGDAARLSASGRDIAGVRTALGGYNRSSGLFESGALGNQGMAYLRAELAKVGLSFKQLQDIAHGLGLAFDDMPTVGQILNLQQALADLDFKAFTETFAGQLDRLHRGFELFGIGDAKDKFAQFIDLLTDPKVGAPALFGVLDGLDLSSSGGIADAQQKLQDLFRRALSGDLSAEELNRLNLQEFLDALSELMGFVHDAAGTITKGQSALDALKAALHTIDVEADILGLSAGDKLKKQVDAFAKIFPQFADILDGLDLSSADDLGKLKQRLREVFKMFEDGTAELPEGTELDDLIQAILTLMGAAADAASGITSAADQIAAAASALQLGFQILGTNAGDQAQQLADLYGFNLGDVSTAAGRDAAIEKLRDLYKANRDNQQLAQQILSVINALQQMQFASSSGPTLTEQIGGSMERVGASASTSAVSSSFAGLTVMQGDAFLDLQRSVAEGVQDLVSIGRDTLAELQKAPGVGPKAAGGAPVQIGPISVYVGEGDDPGRVGEQITDEFVRQLDIRFGNSTMLRDLARGVVGRS